MTTDRKCANDYCDLPGRFTDPSLDGEWYCEHHRKRAMNFHQEQKIKNLEKQVADLEKRLAEVKESYMWEHRCRVDLETAKQRVERDTDVKIKRLEERLEHAKAANRTGWGN